MADQSSALAPAPTTDTAIDTAMRSGKRARIDKADKFSARRDELADAALSTLGEVGFARASLREIAHKTAFSHGLFHYYFNDKIELICYCVRRYKAYCVTRYDAVVKTSRTAPELAGGFADLLVTTLREDTAMHRLWYDLRAQSNYSSGEMRETVIELDAQLESMIWRVLSRYAKLRNTAPAVSSMVAYAAFDGLFENSLFRHIGGDPTAGEELATGARWLIDTVVQD